MLNFFELARIIFGVIIFQDFAAPSLQNDTFDLQIGLFTAQFWKMGSNRVHSNLPEFKSLISCPDLSRFGNIEM